MVNIEDFIKRLEIILDYYSLNASSFADKIGVQRSSMSHLLSGRNKPSLDFILKILEVYPEVDLYWILNGKGSFPQLTVSSKTPNFSPTPISNIKLEQIQMESFPNLAEENNANSKNQKEETVSNNLSKTYNRSVEENEIDQIVVFYKNGTFKTYTPK